MHKEIYLFISDSFLSNTFHSVGCCNSSKYVSIWLVAEININYKKFWLSNRFFNSKKGQTFFVEAISDSENSNHFIAKSILVSECFDIPQQIINYVIKFQESLIIQNATDSSYNQDVYIEQHDCKSIVCMPINFQNEFIGIIYLENNLKTNAFSPFKLEIIKILVSQVAIAIKNARLFASEQEKSRIIKFRSEIDSTLSKSNDLQEMLQQCTKIIVSYLDVEFARIWTYNQQENILNLQSTYLFIHI